MALQIKLYVSLLLDQAFVFEFSYAQESFWE